MKPTARYRLAAGLLLIALAALVVTFILRMPYDPQRLHQSIPAAAVLVSSHHNLAARYENLSTNVFLRPVLEAAGLDPAGLSPGAAAQLRRYAPYVAGHTTLLAWAPRMARTGQPGLIVASWMGRAGLAARWRLELSAHRQLRRQPPYAGHSIWTATQPVNQAGWELTFTIYNGVLLAIVSPDPEGIKEVIQTAERLMPAANARQNPDFQALPAAAPDRFWLRQPAPMAAAITAINPRQFSACINAAGLLPWPGTNLQEADLETMAGVLGDRPVMAAILHADTARQLAAYLPQDLMEFCDDLLSHSAAGPESNCLGLTILTGADGGGFGQPPWRLNIPALVGFVRAGGVENGQAIVRRMLDRLNARHKLGLIADAGTILPGGRLLKIFTIEATTDNFLARLAADDRPAYAIVDGWLLFSSNAGALARRLSAAADGAPQARWQAAVKSTPAAAMLWMDMPGGVRALQLGFTGLALQMRAPGRTDQPFWLKTLRQWLDALRNMQTARLWLAPDAPALFLEISAPAED